MIKVTRLNGKEFIINAEQIITVESTPDSVITLRGGDKYVVLETVDEIMKKSLEYGRSLRLLGS
jgi:flagellar protein FlbD